VCLHCEKSAPCDAAVCQNCLTTYIEDSALRIMLFNAIFRGKNPIIRLIIEGESP